MQAIELYNPTSPHLHVTSLAANHTLSKDLNPLNYQLTTDDFITLVQQDGQLLYTLDPATTTALFWALHRLAKFIVRATSHDVYNDSSIPFASKGYIPQIYFDSIGMQRLDILTIQDHHAINPLCGYTTRENLTAWYQDFQTMGRLAVQWIQVARRQVLQLGPGTGWDWEARHGPRLEYPERRLITMREDSDDLHSDSSSEGSEVGLGSWEGFSEESSEGEMHIVLHPTKSAYGKRYPDFNPFGGRPLIDNGYVNNNNNNCRALIVHPTTGELTHADYMNNLFTVSDRNAED